MKCMITYTLYAIIYNYCFYFILRPRIRECINIIKTIYIILKIIIMFLFCIRYFIIIHFPFSANGQGSFLIKCPCKVLPTRPALHYFFRGIFSNGFFFLRIPIQFRLCLFLHYRSIRRYLISVFDIFICIDCFLIRGEILLVLCLKSSICFRRCIFHNRSFLCRYYIPCCILYFLSFLRGIDLFSIFIINFLFRDIFPSHIF